MYQAHFESSSNVRVHCSDAGHVRAPQAAVMQARRPHTDEAHTLHDLYDEQQMCQLLCSKDPQMMSVKSRQQLVGEQEEFGSDYLADKVESEKEVESASRDAEVKDETADFWWNSEEGHGLRSLGRGPNQLYSCHMTDMIGNLRCIATALVEHRASRGY
ncbi:hypothetical protein K438DRAFT_1757364 [Mycena galopus ATCC 62051]|nr:hypothetical protein K438DRAFT_1757364 [Mycena galopus ATCC 62051]